MRGVRTSGSRKAHSPEDVRPPNAFCARSASLAKPTLITSIASAPHQKNQPRPPEGERTPDHATAAEELGIAIGLLGMKDPDT